LPASRNHAATERGPGRSVAASLRDAGRCKGARGSCFEHARATARHGAKKRRRPEGGRLPAPIPPEKDRGIRSARRPTCTHANLTSSGALILLFVSLFSALRLRDLRL